MLKSVTMWITSNTVFSTITLTHQVPMSQKLKRSKPVRSMPTPPPPPPAPPLPPPPPGLVT